MRTVVTSSGAPLLEVAPEGSAGGAVVVIHPAEGVNAYVQRVCGRLADLGHHVVAPDLFHRLPAAERAAPASRERTAALRDDDIGADLDATFEYLARTGFPFDRCGILGFCMGGTVALTAAATYPLRAAVTFYGGGIAQGRWGGPPLREVAPLLRTPWLGLYGEEDKNILMDDVRALTDAAGRATVAQRVVTYPGAGHGFHSEDRPSFEPAAAAAAWEEAVSWLAPLRMV